MTDHAVTVSVVIPTVGRRTLRRSVESALRQTQPPAEVLVVADTDATLDLPEDDRIVVLSPGAGTGRGGCRQIGIDKAQGAIIALLDDDDTWHADKLQRQLHACRDAGGTWISATRIVVRGPGDRRRVWPRRLIGPRQPAADYLFRRRELESGGAVLQTSTLCFPTSLGRRIRWDIDEGVHDEAGWLLRAQRAVADLSVIHVPDALGDYNVHAASFSRSTVDRTDEYVRWGLEHLREEPSRVRGDYLCTSPVSAAVAAGSIRGAATAIGAGLRHGRPGGYALGYAAASLFRIVGRRGRALLGAASS